MPWGTFRAYMAWLIRQQDRQEAETQGRRPPERGDDGRALADPYGFSRPPRLPPELA